MILKQGNIFDDFDSLDFVGITTNSILNKHGELVMGAGIAKTAKQHNKQKLNHINRNVCIIYSP